jgi:hypothetical protein
MKSREQKWVGALALFVLLVAACRKAAEPERPAGAGGAIAAAADIDPEKIAAATGVRFRILKTETIGQTPRHLFYWISLGNGDPGPKLETLAEAIIRGTITARPRTFHSFIVHFFRESELKGSVEKSTPFARATFLPEGNWQKVGRASIEGYSGYALACVRLDKR